VSDRRPTRAVVFDIGGVLVDWNPRYLYRRLLDEDAVERFLSDVCTMEWHHKHDAGYPMADNASELAAEHPESADLIDVWRIRWPEMFGGPIHETVETLERLVTGGIPVYGLTNWPAEKFDEALETFPFLRLLQPIVVSGREGVTKPDPALFEILIARTGLDPSSTLYIDDAAANIATAETLGFAVHLFTTPGRLARDLADRRVI
jgi:FMN phosphatase YigB (HAD superfamily)